jgi:hypothetical protein
MTVSRRMARAIRKWRSRVRFLFADTYALNFLELTTEEFTGGLQDFDPIEPSSLLIPQLQPGIDHNVAARYTFDGLLAGHFSQFVAELVLGQFAKRGVFGCP